MDAGLKWCQRTGNCMGATTLLSLASTLANGDFSRPKRVGVFSYGSGCCSEFFSGVGTPAGRELLRKQGVTERLDRRYELDMAAYDDLLKGNNALRFGTRDFVVDQSLYAPTRSALGQPVLFLKAINNFHREYEWVQ
jgi:polyketide biosynthesis 3-hydroxy-3-methylglutaryl-CoA synthase-like enzyme PksG